jgi:hypothetical protein
LVSRVWDISSGIADMGPCFPLAGGLVQNKQQANPLLSIHHYTPLVISKNDKNKQLTLLSQRRINREKYTFCHIKSLEQIKILQMAPSSI